MKVLLSLVLCCIAAASFAQSDEKPVYAPLKTVTGDEGPAKIENITLRRTMSVYLPIDVKQISSSRENSYQSTYISLSQEHSSTVHKVPTRSLNSAVNSVPLVLSRDGETPSIRGARPEGTAYYFDGVRMLSGVVRGLR